jgi:hypothetical protein
MYMDDVQYWKDVDRYVLAAVKLGAKKGWFCCRAKIHAVLFILSREFKELAHLRSPFGMENIDVDVSIRRLVECLPLDYIGLVKPRGLMVFANRKEFARVV